MMTSLVQGSLFDRVPAGKIDTSIAAFDSQLAEGKRSKDAYRIYTLIANHNGLTIDEAVQIAEIPTQTVSARFNDLLRAGLIKRSGRKRPTRTGRLAHVCVAAVLP